MRRGLISGAADILAGLTALIVFLALDSLVHVAADLRRGVVVIALLYALAGFARGAGQPQNTWVKSLLVACGGSLAFLLLGWNAISRPVLGLLLLASLLFTMFGVRARRLWTGRSMAKRAATLLVPVAALVVFAVAVIPTFATRVATRRVNVPAPKFSITASDGSLINADGLRGRVVVLDFWATWCQACRRELPELDKLYRRYERDSRVSFWAVDVLSEDETVEKAKEFIARNRYAQPVAFVNDKSAKVLGIDGLPRLMVLDESGRVRLIHDSFDESERLQSELTTEIEALLREGKR